ncbi:hypothetical protein ACE1B6_10890 [Aerosakkonemataceae cyanobacterium BLCC-F154]|uniref:Uncharacterized protein n=1 Tax=Floridaenema fluviatile BLCC-F154 TaxID=3153640 RepID=A0ABV4YAB1_9CYAN
MSSNLVEKINASDFDSVAFLQYFSQGILDGLVDDFDELTEGIPPEVKSIPEFAELDRLSYEESQFKGKDAVVISRHTLTALAKNERFSPLIEKALEAYNNREDREDMEMGGGSAKDLLAIGLAASMVLVVSTPKSIHFEKTPWGKVVIDIEQVNPEFVKNAGILITAFVAATKVVNSGGKKQN